MFCVNLSHSCAPQQDWVDRLRMRLLCSWYVKCHAQLWWIRSLISAQHSDPSLTTRLFMCGLLLGSGLMLTDVSSSLTPGFIKLHDFIKLLERKIVYSLAASRRCRKEPGSNLSVLFSYLRKVCSCLSGDPMNLSTHRLHRCSAALGSEGLRGCWDSSLRCFI